MALTKLSELFAYENIVNEKTNKARVLCWNNRTMLIAESNSMEVVQKQLSFDELIHGVVSSDYDCIVLLLFSACVSADNDFNIETFVEYFDEEEMGEYESAVLDGMLNYMPSEALQTELQEINSVLSDPSAPESETDLWAFNYFFVKKHFAMSDEEFLNSTWRTISLLQRELLKTSSDYQKSQTVSAEYVDI